VCGVSCVIQVFPVCVHGPGGAHALSDTIHAPIGGADPWLSADDLGACVACVVSSRCFQSVYMALEEPMPPSLKETLQRVSTAMMMMMTMMMMMVVMLVVTMMMMI
jgi:hypothetical protein